MTRNNENNITDVQEIQVLTDAIKNSAKSYFGVTGNTTLNNMGDRAKGEYDFWKVATNMTNDKRAIWLDKNK